ncbi:MAG TPA: ATP-dependent RNA helicase RhlB [Pseudomonadales bacterium]
MIKHWIKKIGQRETPAAEQASPPPAAVHRKQPDADKPKHKKNGKAKAKAGNDQPAWDISQFQVAEVPGKTRFHDFGLHPQLMQAIHQLGFDYCTPIQAQTLPHTLKGLDMIGKAQTGTGKTAAFLITIIDQLLHHPVEDERFLAEPRALVIAPTRELVQQIADDAKQLCRYTDLHVVAVVGGEPFEKQHKKLEAGYVDILIATPGRLIDFVQRGNVYLDQVETLVLDEADRMLDMGFIPQVKRIVRATPAKEDRQTLLFSATFTQDIINLSQQWTMNPARVEIEPENVATDTVKQIAWMVADSDKFTVLLNLLREGSLGQTIVFANRRDQTQRLYDRLVKKGVRAGILSGEIAQNKRTRTLDDFKKGKIQILIATDVVGRGIHIDGISHVVNYNLPQEPENYVHRIGRTGRAGASGTSISLIGEEDAYEVLELEKLLGKKIVMDLPPDALLKRG